MLTVTAAVFITFTATATPTFTPTPTTVPTRTLQEDRDYLFNELVKCGTAADKAMHDSYEAGWKDGVHYQWCAVQCKFLKHDRESIDYWQEEANQHPDNHFYKQKVISAKQELAKDRKMIKQEHCNCSSYKDR